MRTYPCTYDIERTLRGFSARYSGLGMEQGPPHAESEEPREPFLGVRMPLEQVCHFAKAKS